MSDKLKDPPAGSDDIVNEPNVSKPLERVAVVSKRSLITIICALLSLFAMEPRTAFTYLESRWNVDVPGVRFQINLVLVGVINLVGSLIADFWMDHRVFTIISVFMTGGLYVLAGSSYFIGTLNENKVDVIFLCSGLAWCELVRSVVFRAVYSGANRDRRAISVAFLTGTFFFVRLTARVSLDAAVYTGFPINQVVQITFGLLTMFAALFLVFYKEFGIPVHCAEERPKGCQFVQHLRKLRKTCEGVRKAASERMNAVTMVDALDPKAGRAIRNVKLLLASSVVWVPLTMCAGYPLLQAENQLNEAKHAYRAPFARYINAAVMVPVFYCFVKFRGLLRFPGMYYGMAAASVAAALSHAGLQMVFDADRQSLRNCAGQKMVLANAGSISVVVNGSTVRAGGDTHMCWAEQELYIGIKKPPMELKDTNVKKGLLVILRGDAEPTKLHYDLKRSGPNVKVTYCNISCYNTEVLDFHKLEGDRPDGRFGPAMDGGHYVMIYGDRDNQLVELVSPFSIPFWYVLIPLILSSSVWLVGVYSGLSISFLAPQELGCSAVVLLYVSALVGMSLAAVVPRDNAFEMIITVCGLSVMIFVALVLNHLFGPKFDVSKIQLEELYC